MSAKVLITFEGEADSLKATINEVAKVNTDVQKKAVETADILITKYKEQLKASVAAFSSGEVKKSIDENTKAIAAIDKEITKLINEENRLVKARMTTTDSYKKNQEAGMKLREELEKLRIKEQVLGDATGKTEAKFKSLRLQLREAKVELQKLEDTGQDGTNSFNELALSVAKLEDRIGDLNERTKALSSDTFKFDVAVDAAQQLAAGFAIAQGAAAIFGDENKDLQKVIAKTQGAMAVLQGVQQVGKFITGQSSAAIAIQTGLQQINEASVRQSAITYTVLGKSVQFTSLQLNIMKGAIAATGIGALVIGIILLVQKMSEITAQTEKYNQTLEKSKEGSIAAKEAIKSLREIQESYTEKLSVLGKVQTQEEVDRKVAVKEAEKTYTDAYVARRRQLKDIDAEMEKGIKREQELTDSIIKERNRLAKEGNAGGLLGEATKQDQLNRKVEALKGEKERNQATRTAFEQGQKDLIGLIGTNRDAQSKINAFYDVQDNLQQTEAAKKALDLATKQADERLQILQNILKKDEVLNGASLKNKIEQAEIESKIAINAAKGSIENRQLLNSKIELLEVQLQQKLIDIRVDEINKVAQLEIDKLKARQSLGKDTLQTQVELAQLEYEIQKNNAEKIKADDAAYKAALLKAETDYSAKLIPIIQKRNSDVLVEKRQEVLLTIAANGETLQSNIDLINANASIRLNDIQNSKDTDEIKKNNTLLANAETIKLIRAASITAEQTLLNDKVTAIDLLTRKNESTINERVKGIQYSAEVEILELEKVLGKTEEFEKKRKQIVAKTEQDIRDEKQRSRDEAIAQAQEYVNAFTNVATSVANLSKELGNQYIDQVTTQKDAEIASINASIELEADKQRKRLAAEKRASTAIAGEKIRQAKLDKSLAYFNAVINVAASIAKVVGNPVLVTLAAIAGAVQIATIIATPLPKFKKGGLVGGRSHEAGGTTIEAEKDEFVVNKVQYAKHSNEVRAINRSSAEFRKLINEKYVKPELIKYMLNSRRADGINVNAVLNSKSMEDEIKGLRSDIRKSAKSKQTNSQMETRYLWQ